MNKILSTQLTRRALALVLAGGRGKRLHELTARRAKPAVYFGGKFRIIDFALSNCVNSGVRRIGVITQYESNSLLRHLQKGWAYLRWEMGEFVEILPAQQQMDGDTWYRGTADAVWQNIGIIRDLKSEFILVLAGDHVYKMDYSIMLRSHVDRGAQCTVACIEVPRAEASAFGVMSIDSASQILEFVEKPENPKELPGKPDRSLASMGIYVFNTGYLLDLLQQDIADKNSSHDFGRDIVPEAVRQGAACAHPFSLSCVGADPDLPYWRDVGSVDSYWSANIDLTTPTPALNMYDTNWPIWTYQEQLAPAKFVFDSNDRRGMAVDSIISGGCIVSGSRVASSVLFSECRVNSYCKVEGAVLLPGVEVGRYARLNKVIVDRGCHIPEGLVIGEDAEADAARFFRTDNGVTLVTQEGLDRLANRVTSQSR